jgi:radial spoke head protein 4A
MATFEESLQFLRKESSDGVSLYDHLSEVLLKVLAERPEDASSAFEHISAGVKELRASPAPKVPSISREAEKAAQLKWATEAQALLKEPEEPTEGGPTPPNVVEQANLWSLAGVSFGQLETFRIHLAVNQLAASLPGEHLQLRFWGRISTRGASDYLIVEGRALDDQLGEFEEATMEVR